MNMTDVAKGLSNDLAEVVERGGTSVVRVESSRAPGSGVVWSADGVIVAASHSVEGDEAIEVGLPDGSTTPGIVSVRGEAWRTPSGGRLDHYVQTDLARHPGFSGGLLVGAGGEALGLNTTGLLRGATLAVTGSTLRRGVEALVAHGQVRRGFLGIGTYPVRLPAALEKEAGQPVALMLVSVEPGSPADKAGLRLGDALLTFAGQALRHPSDLLGLLDAERIGAEVTVRLLRAGELREVALTVGTRNS